MFLDDCERHVTPLYLTFEEKIPGKNFGQEIALTQSAG